MQRADHRAVHMSRGVRLKATSGSQPPDVVMWRPVHVTHERYGRGGVQREVDLASTIITEDRRAPRIAQYRHHRRADTHALPTLPRHHNWTCCPPDLQASLGHDRWETQPVHVHPCHDALVPLLR